MRLFKRIDVVAICVFLMGISWLVASAKQETDAERQASLIAAAEDYLKDEIYVRAVPLLEEAASYEAEYTVRAESLLKETYLKLSGKNDYMSRYTDLLDKQMAREPADSKVFEEAANYYFSISYTDEAFAVLRDGIAKTDGAAELVEMYEDTRYAYEMGGAVYQDVTETYNDTIAVRRDGLWGIAGSRGGVMIPCEYDAVSTFSDGSALVLKDSLVYAVDSGDNRVAINRNADGFTNLAEDRVGLYIDGVLTLSAGGLEGSGATFEDMGMFSNGYAAAKQNGKWGLVGTDGVTWLVEPQYEKIICDELGRAYSQEAFFAVEDDGSVILFSGENKEKVGDTYEDAKPFKDGWAAVKKNGKWGYIDTAGNVMIDYQFDEALSFSQHLAAVKLGERWGFVSKYGEMVIEPIFLSAKSFYNGSAPVLTDEGWSFITLIEYAG